MSRKILTCIICLLLVLSLAACGDSGSSYDDTTNADEISKEEVITCIVDGCNKEGIINYEGISGETEYYCTTHYDEMLENIKEVMGEDSDLYKYSEYIKKEYLEDELLEWFEEYNIRYYDESLVEEFSNMDLPMPHTAIADYPSYTEDDGAYLYGWDDEEECRVYLSAYMVYLMHFDYEVTELGNNVYSIDNEYYIGLGLVDGKYSYMIVELD